MHVCKRSEDEIVNTKDCIINFGTSDLSISDESNINENSRSYLGITYELPVGL